MPPDIIWSDNLNKSETNLNDRSIEWKNLMNECLMATQIKIHESFSAKHLNPNAVMRIRHEMAKKYLKTSPTPRCQIQSEAMKLMREDNYRKFLKIREENLIKTEIGRLKQILECHEILSKKDLQRDEKDKYEKTLPKVYSKNMKSRILKVHRQNQIGKIEQAGISEKAINKAKEIEVTSTKKAYLDNKKYEVNLQTYVKSSDILVKFVETSEIEIPEINKTQIKPILPLIKKLNQRRLKRAWQKWKIYTQRQRRREREREIIADKIERFLRKLQQPGKKAEAQLRITMSKEKPKMLTLFRKPRNSISDEERLERLQKLMGEVKMSQAEAWQKLCSRNVRLKKDVAKPKFLFRIEERREERLRRLKEIQVAKQKLKEEKEKIQKQQEEKTKKMTEQEKRKRIKKLKEKRRAEKEKKEAQKKQRDKLKNDQFLAKSHYKKFLLRSYGLRPWLRLMMLTGKLYQQAVEFHDKRLLQFFLKWRASIRDEMEKKERHAEQLFNQNLVKRCWNCWVKFRMEKMCEKQVAQDWNDFKISETMFRKWMRFTEKENLEYQNKKEIAELSYKRKLKWKYLQKLRSYPEYKKEVREKEMRKLKWRQKAKEILPDYQTMEIGQDW